MLETGKWKDVSYIKTVNTNMGANIRLWLYVVDGLLVDCGAQCLEDDFRDFLLNTAINQAVITHLHEDHCGNAAWVERNLRVPIYIHPEDIEEAAREGEYAEYRRLTWGDQPPFHALPMPEVVETEKYRFQVIDAPGHMARQQLLYEPSQGWLFSADLYVRSKLRFCAAEENMQQYISSLGKVLKLDFETVFCAHEGILENGREKLRRKLDFLLELQGRVEAYRQQGMSDEEIDRVIFPEEQLITAVSGGEWSSLNVIRTI